VRDIFTRFQSPLQVVQEKRSVFDFDSDYMKEVRALPKARAEKIGKKGEAGARGEAGSDQYRL